MIFFAILFQATQRLRVSIQYYLRSQKYSKVWMCNKGSRRTLECRASILTLHWPSSISLYAQLCIISIYTDSGYAYIVQYIAIEIPSNLALKRFGSIWLACLITSFGAVTIGTAFIKSYTGLIVTRVFLGLAEGGTLVRAPMKSRYPALITRVIDLSSLVWPTSCLGLACLTWLLISN